MEKLMPDKIDEISVLNYLDTLESNGYNNELLNKIRDLLSITTSIEISDDVMECLYKIVELEIKEFDDDKPSMMGTDEYYLKNEINTAKNYNNHVLENEDGSFSIYPSLDKNNYPFIKELTNYLISNNTTIKNSKKEVNNLIVDYNLKTREKLINGKINPYYGNAKYLIERIATINNGMLLLKNENLTNEERLKLTSKIESLEPLINSYVKITNNLEETKYRTDYKVTKEEYDILNSCYKQFLLAEEELSFISGRVWREYMSENNIRLVHSLSSGIVSTNDMDKICTTVSSPEHFQAPYGNVGYEYEMDMSHIYCISPEDAGSWRIEKANFLDRGVSTSWQYDESGLFYEFGNHSKLLPPSYVYNTSQKYTSNTSYTEVIINNNDRTIRPVAAFITNDATEEEIAKIKAIAEKENLEIVYRNNIKRRSENESKFL